MVKLVGAQVKVIEEFLQSISREIGLIIPKIIIATLIIVVTYLSLRILSYILKKLLGFADIDSLVRKYWGEELPFSFNKLIVFLVYIAVLLASIYGIVSLFITPEYMQAVSSMIVYGTRIISVVVVALIFFTIFTVVIEKVRVESRLRGYIFFIITLLLTSMIIDVTTLSESVKESLYMGLSIGIGASLAVFAIWFFFHEYIERYLIPQKEKKK
jgi:amino acid permease